MEITNPCHDKNNNKLWSMIEAIKWLILCLSPQGRWKTETSVKANVLNRQFQSVFTSETPNLPWKPLENIFYPTMPDIHITKKGVEKLLLNLNPNKATGPGGLSPRLLLLQLLKELSSANCTNLTNQLKK